MYEDPENVNDILQELKNCPTLGDIYKLINRVYPTWIIEFIGNYSFDYPHLRSNWIEATRKANIKPAQIMIVDYLGMTAKYSLIQHFAEIYTICGFIVRSKDEVCICSVCNRVLAGESQHRHMLELKLPVPDVWSDKCTGCEGAVELP